MRVIKCQPEEDKMEITIPHNFTPRTYQLPVLRALDGNINRAVCVWHRRAGKDKTGLNFTIKKMMERVGVYYYFLPTYNQGKKIIWDGIDKEGFKFLDHFPEQLIEKKNEAEMKIILKNGSLFQIIGTDNYNSIMGTNPVGCVFSEYSLQDPVVWDFIRPIMRENKGWALFLYTPRGENHGYDLYTMAQDNPDWFSQLLTIKDTFTPNKERIITDEDIDAERREGMSDELIDQEYFCSFEGMVHGAYYTHQYKKAQEENRITNVQWEEGIKVDTWWDLGMADVTSIWFSQIVGQEFRLIDYYEESGEGLAHYAKVLQDKPYIYGFHNAPHDIEVRELGTGVSRKEMAKKLGIDFRVVPNIKVEDGINAVRSIFNQCWFDKTKCKQGLDALRNYHKEYDQKRRTFQKHPYHDWSSHAADSFRYFAVGIEQRHPKRIKISKEDREFYRRMKAKNKKKGSSYKLKMA